MAAEKVSGSEGDLGAVETRLKELRAKLDELHAAQSSAKVTSRLIAVLIMIAAIIGVYLLLSPFYAAYKDSDPYVKALQEEFGGRVKETLVAELQDSMKTLGPEVGKLVVEKLKSRQEDVMATVDTQATMLMTNLQAYTEKALADATVEIEAEMKKRISETVPELEDQEVRETVVGNAGLALEQAVQRVIDERLQPHIEALVEIQEDILAFPVPDTLKAMSDTELSDELNRALAEYAMLTLRHSLDPDTREMLRNLAEEPQ